MSLPPRGAWIEIKRKFIFKNVIGGRSPCEERGLKLESGADKNRAARSLPLRGAWLKYAEAVK